MVKVSIPSDKKPDLLLLPKPSSEDCSEDYELKICDGRLSNKIIKKIAANPGWDLGKIRNEFGTWLNAHRVRVIKNIIAICNTGFDTEILAGKIYRLDGVIEIYIP